MAYFNGSASDMAAVRSALIDACVADGWTWNSSAQVLSKNGVFLLLQLNGSYLRLTGRTSESTGNSPHPVQIGPWTGYSGNPLPALAWPVTYHISVFAQEVYCVINYASDCYQWLAFGKSTIQGLYGTGMWLGASGQGAQGGYSDGLSIVSSGGGGSYGGSVACPAPFWREGPQSGYAVESFVHSDLDGSGWFWNTTYEANAIGAQPLRPLMELGPNTWNSESVLLPIRAYKTRLEGKQSLTADLQHARYLRIDNYTPSQVINRGSDRWMVFPFYRKNSDLPNGSGYQAAHSGCLGWAIRYEGP